MSYHITSEVLILYYSGLVTMLNDVRVIRSCRNLQNNFGIAVLPDPFSKGLAHARLACLCVHIAIQMGRTVLMCAALNGHQVLMQPLLDHGANLYLRDNVCPRTKFT